MLLDLCGTVSVAGATVSAPLRNDAVRLPNGDAGELGYPAFLIAEAFAQIACRAAQKIEPLEGHRYLPTSLRSLEIIETPLKSCAGARLVAEPVRSRPLPEFACSLVGPDNSVLARTAVVVAPAPPPAPSRQQMEGRP